MIGIFKVKHENGNTTLVANTPLVDKVWFAGQSAAYKTGELRMVIICRMVDGRLIRVASDEEDVRIFYDDSPSLEDALIKKLEQILNG